VNNPSGAKTKAIIYVRVSTQKQGDSGLGLEAQRMSCQKFAVSNDIDVVEIITDVESGASADRAGLHNALNALETGRANAILVADITRLTRDSLDGEEMTRKWFSNKTDHLLLSVAEQYIDTRTAKGRRRLRDDLSEAQYERERTSEKTIAGLAVKKTQLAKTGDQLGAPTAEQKVPESTKLLLELHKQGVPERQIADILNQRGIPTARGGQWRQNSVQNVIKRDRDRAKKAVEVAATLVETTS
jgi:DNA invertase Pin-like site-specific DNA recombinase